MGGGLEMVHAFDRGIYKFLPSKWAFWKIEA